MVHGFTKWLVLGDSRWMTLYAKYWRILSISESYIKKVILSKQHHHKGYHILGRVSHLLCERE